MEYEDEQGESDDEEAEARNAYNIEEAVNAFVDELWIRHNSIQDSESEGEEEGEPRRRNRRDRTDIRRGDGNLFEGQVFFNSVSFKEAVLDYALKTGGCGRCGIFYALICLGVGVPCLYSCTYRTKIRSKFGLPESPASDCITHCFCECCALCQEYRELKNRGLDPSLGWSGHVQRTMAPPMSQQMMA